MKLNIKSLLLENTSIKQTIFKNTFWLIIAEVITHFLQFVMVIYIVRTLGVTQFGKFSFAMAFVSLLAVFSNFGLVSVTTREFSHGKNNDQEYADVLSLKIILSFVMLVVMLIGSFFISHDLQVQKIIWILSGFILLNDFFTVIYAFLRSRQKMEGESWIKVGQALVITGLVFFVLLMFPSIENVGLGYLIANVISLASALVFFHFFMHPLRLGFNHAIWHKFLKMSWILGFSTIFGAIFSGIDMVIMGYFGQITEVGWYNASKQIIIALIIPSALIFTSFFPLLSKYAKESQEKLVQIWNFYLHKMILLAFPMVVGGLLLAPNIIDFFYGPTYGSSVSVFRILILMAGINFLYDPPYVLLIASHRQNRVFWITLFGVAVNIALNMALIPKFSLYGAATAQVITYGILWLLLLKSSNDVVAIFPVNFETVKVLVATMIASAGMAILIILPFVYHLHVIISVALGVLAYFLLLYMFHIMVGLALFKKIYL